MIGDKKRLNLESIENLLLGSNPQEGIRYIDVNYYSNEAKLFIRKKDDEKSIIEIDTFRPFCWFKGFDFNRDFAWKYFSIYSDAYDLDGNCVLIGDQVLPLSENLQVVGTSPDGQEIFLKQFIEDVTERKKLCYSKIKEYGIEISESITSTGKTVTRLEEGFKYLIHINGQDEPKNYTNPVLAYTKNGTLKKINGSFSNLIDFFAEGGLDMWKKSGVFLNKHKFTDFWKNGSDYQKYLFFLGFPLKSLLFSILDTKSVNTELLKTIEQDEIGSSFTVVDMEELIQLTNNVFGEKIKESKIFEFYERKIKDNDLTFIQKILPQLKKIIKLDFDSFKFEQLLENDYSFESKKGFKDLNGLFLQQGIDVFFGEERLFYNVSPLEQYMIQTEKRLFKGFEEYPELRIMTMDIETKALESFSHRKDAALFPHMGRIFKIGVLCNNGFEVVLNATNDKEEIQIIEDFFKIVCENDPDLFLTYNGEHFDFPFIVKRYELLKNFADEDETYIAIRHLLKDYYTRFENIYISNKKYFYRRNGNLKVGGSSEHYMQTTILGVNVCDTMFAVKRAAAINKSIPNFKLKDNIKHANLAKKNRVYVDGDKIGTTENSTADFYLNPNNGHWIKYHKELIFKTSEYSSKNVKKKSSSTFVYGDEDTLYVWDEQYDPFVLNGCMNTLKFNPNLDVFFNELYTQFKNFDKICFRAKNFAGEWLKDNSPKEYEKMMAELKKIRNNISNKEFFYPEIDFTEYKKTTGSEIVKQYLIDDLWETVKLDEHYSQATFLISKWLPTSYQRAATMGGASVWKLLLTTYAYKYGLAIPEFDEPREFSGGLVAMVSCGYHGKSFKADFSSLYPAEFYVHVKTPDIDLFGVYKLFMYYGWSQRIKYKKLMNEYKEKGDMELSKKYDVRQLPIKILINSFYGMMGAAGVTPFADLLIAQGITCNGRQHLRHLIKWFTNRGFFATIAHTDGVFFAIANADLSYKYIGKGINWLVVKDKEYEGIAAYVAEYNDLYMKGIMGLDIDEIVESVINFSKGNYFYYKVAKNKKTGELEDKLEIVGGAIIKKTQSEYITEFVDNEVLKLMKNQPTVFINSYWDYINKIYSKKLNLKTIASKAKVKKSKEEYLEHIKGVNKNGRPLNRQVHMEMLIQSEVDFEIGDTVYYVNTGNSIKDKDSSSVNTTFATYEVINVDLNTIDNVFKTNNRKRIKDFLLKLDSDGYLTINSKVLDGDLQAILSDMENWKDVKYKVKNLKKGIFVDFIKTEYIINCTLVDEYTSGEDINYNSDLYIHKFNSAVHPLFVVFKPEIRNKLMITKPQDRPFVLSSELELINSIPFEKHESTQTSYDELMEIAPEEMEYWDAIQTHPDNFMIERK